MPQTSTLVSTSTIATTWDAIDVVWVAEDGSPQRYYGQTLCSVVRSGPYELCSLGSAALGGVAIASQVVGMAIDTFLGRSGRICPTGLRHEEPSI